MDYQKKRLNNCGLRAQIDMIRFKSQQALFCYDSHKKCIQLTQMVTEPYIYYSEYQSRAINPVINSFILDEGLSVIQQTNQNKENLQRKLEQHTKNQEQQIFLSFLTGVYDIQQPSLDPIPYVKYPELNDFQINRTGFGRSVQSYKIRSDEISREHCEIVRVKSCSKTVVDRQKALRNILMTKTPLKYKFKLLPDHIWQNIFEFAQPEQKYLIRDYGSRNGTYIHELGKWHFELKQNFQYEIDQQPYGIHINKIFTSADTPNQTILQHNAKVSKMIEQYMKQVSWCYYESAKKSLLVSQKDIKNNKQSKFMVLVFKLKTRQPHEYYFIGMAQDCDKIFTIGCHQEIDVYPEQYDSPSLHASIGLRNGKWVLQAMPTKNWNYSVNSADSQSVQISEKYKKIWVRPPKDKYYVCQTNKKYKFRLGYSNIFELQFNNY